MFCKLLFLCALQIWAFIFRQQNSRRFKTMTKRAAMLLIVFLHQTCTSTFYIHIVYNFIIMHDDSWSARHWTISATISDACLKFISKSSKTIMLIIIRHADFGQNTDFSFDPSLRRNFRLLHVFWSVRVPCSPHILLRFMIRCWICCAQNRAWAQFSQLDAQFNRCDLWNFASLIGLYLLLVFPHIRYIYYIYI